MAIRKPPKLGAEPDAGQRVKRPKARIRRPRLAELPEALSALDHHRPDFVPEDAMLFASWVKLPSDNQQRDQKWTIKRGWQEPIINDFSNCMSLYPHPGVLTDARVHILMVVPKVGDEKNRASRAKFVIDRLQVKREVPYKKPGKDEYGVRTYGLLGLIKDDSILTDQTCTLAEKRATISTDVNECKVLMWVWDEPQPAF